MQKQVHVNSYVKRDGTQVKEHFRTIDTDNYGTGPIFSEYPNYPIMDKKNYNSVKNFLSNILNPTMNMESAPVLQGGVSVDVGFPTGSGAGDVGAGAGLGNILSDVSGILGTVAAVGLEFAPIALQMSQAMNSGNVQAVEYLRPQFDTKMKQLDTHVAQMKTNIDNNITKLVNAKNQNEYSKIYEPLQKDWQEYQSAKNIVNRIKVHANNGDFQSVANDLGNFTSGDLTQNWDKNGKIYYTNQSGQAVNMKIPTSEYLKNQAKAFATNTNNWINETNPSSEAYKQKLYLTSLLASAPLSLETGITGEIGQALLPLLGQRISQMAAQGLSNGVASGALSGFAKGLIYNQNPFLTSAQDAALFSILGGGGNLALGNIEKAIMQYQIYPSPLKEVLIDNYIKNYVKGLDNITNELNKIRAMRVGSPPWQNTVKNISYDLKALKYTGKCVRLDGVTYREIWLPKDEYAPVEHALSTYAKQNNLRGKIVDITIPHEYDMLYYTYTAIIDKNGTPIIIIKEISK